jgi:hypothetical protein
MDGKHPNPRARRVVALAAISLLAAGACGAPPEDVDDADPLSDTLASAESVADLPPDTAEETAPPAGGRGLRAELEARGGTDVTGTVSLTPVAGGAAVSVEIHGANSGLPYVAELVGGSCVSPTEVIAVLGQVTAGEAGDGEVRDVLGAELLDTGGASRIVRVRGAGDQTAIVACGNLGPG